MSSRASLSPDWAWACFAISKTFLNASELKVPDTAPTLARDSCACESICLTDDWNSERDVTPPTRTKGVWYLNVSNAKGEGDTRSNVLVHGRSVRLWAEYSRHYGTYRPQLIVCTCVATRRWRASSARHTLVGHECCLRFDQTADMRHNTVRQSGRRLLLGVVL